MAWALAMAKVRQGHDVRTVLFEALRNGAVLPEDPAERRWVLDGLEGKLAPKRGRGRPPLKARPSLQRQAVEAGVYEAYQRWLWSFGHRPEEAWLAAEALQLQDQHPEARVFRRFLDLGEEADRIALARKLESMGVRPEPHGLRGGKTPRELALSATVLECKGGWKAATGQPLTAAVVAKVVTREEKRRSARKAE